MTARGTVKTILGTIPFAAEVDWALYSHRKRAIGRFSLEKLSSMLPEMVAQTKPFAEKAGPGKRILIFASLHFWIQHAVVTGLALAGLGHKVSLLYLPHARYDRPTKRFDLLRQNVYARNILRKALPYIDSTSLLDLHAKEPLPAELQEAINKVCLFDTQYILQKEEVRGDEPVYRMRLERNIFAARKALAWLKRHRPDVVIIPNGMIQEFGAVYEVTRSLEIPVVTYEFGEQDQCVWLELNNLVMYHLTDGMWATRRDRRLSANQREWLENFLAARQGMKSGDGFAHLYQTSSRAGSEKIRSELGLDDRPVVLLPTNVMGDSATLGRTLFSKSIAEWIASVVTFFADRPQVQLIIRVHPAEAKSVGPSVLEVLHQTVPSIPDNIHVIGPAEKVNTYDLIDITDLALVFTTTAGLEMTTRGIPVAVSGDAHFRGKGFTIDAESWDEYYSKLDLALKDLPAHRLNGDQMETARNYAYAYFREYPQPFPWHIEHLWTGLEKRPLSYVLGEGRNKYESTFRQLAGEPPEWDE